MRTVKWSLCCIFLLALSGCGSLGQPQLPQTPKQKVLGYQGAVAPFRRPITLRYHQVPPFQYVYRQKVLFGTNQKDLSLSGPGFIQSAPAGLRVELAVNHLTVGKNQLSSHTGSPLVRCRELIDPIGSVKQFSLDTAPLEQRGWHIPRRGTPQFQEFSYPFKQLILTFPRQSITMGSLIGGWHNGERPFLNLAGRILPQGAITRNTLQAQAAGLTTVNDRKHLVVLISGEYRRQHNKDYVDLHMNGYNLIDIDSDLATASVLQVRISVFKDGKDLPGYEATIHRSITFKDAPRG